MAKNKPGIRFQGFNDEWKEATLSSLFNFNIPHNSLSRDKLNDEKGEVKDVHYGDVLIKYGAIVDAQKDQIPYITDSHASEYTAALLKDGDVVFADTAEDATAGKAVELQNVESNYVVAGLHTIVARPNETFSPYYLGYCFNSDKYHSKLVPLLQGIKVFSINKPALADTTFTFPLNKDEQKKIGEFFMQLDELINAKEQELEKLRQLKLALLDGMFPGDNQDNSNGGGKSLIYSMLNKNNEFVLSEMPNTPAIRFRGFTEPWRQATFGDYGYICMCKRVMKHQTTTKGDVPFFKIGTFGGSPDAYISRDLFLSLSHNYSYPRKGDILISAAGTLGRTVEFTGEEQYFQDSNIVWLNHSGKLYNPFLKVLYSIVKWTSVEGSTLKRLYNNNILNTQILVPQFDEQRKIGDFFRQQDETIANAQMQILKLRNIKQACMDKMFA